MALLGAWLANRQTIISGPSWPRAQSKAGTRAAIIACLKELN
jgi:hypothetical protein